MKLELLQFLSVFMVFLFYPISGTVLLVDFYLWWKSYDFIIGLSSSDSYSSEFTVYAKICGDWLLFVDFEGFCLLFIT